MCRAIEEVIIYFINPYIKYREEWIERGIFDEVWLCCPYKRYFEQFKRVLTLIGLTSAYGGVVRRAKSNPFVREKAKRIFSLTVWALS